MPFWFQFNRNSSIRVMALRPKGEPNAEQIAIADVDLSKLVENRIRGTTIPLHHKRIDM